MTQKVSQMTIPLNPTTLFTTVVGAIIIGFLFYLSDIPKNIETTQTDIKMFKESSTTAIESLKKDNTEIKDKIDKQWPMIVEHGQRIQRIEDTRFTNQDAEKLADTIVSRVKITMQPAVNQIERNTDDIQQLDSDLKDIIRKGVTK